MNTNNPNIEALELVAYALGDLRDELVLVGGCTVGLLISDPASAPVRETLDVDLVAEMTTLSEYYDLCGRLNACGFRQSADDEHLCRWVKGSLKLDVMPSSSDVLGHSTNRWYPDAIATATSSTLASGAVVRVVSPPVFLATKLEAFHNRGDRDYAGSHDLEDIINVVDGRPELVDEVDQAPINVRGYLREEFDELLANQKFVDAIPMHLRSDSASQARLSIILKRLQQLAGL